MKKLVAFLTAAIMIAAMALPAMAADDMPSTQEGEQYSYNDWNGTIAGGKAVLKKYLVTDQGTEIPGMKFAYEVTSVGIGAYEGNLELAANGDITSPDPYLRTVNVYKGLEPDKVVVDPVEFNSQSPVVNKGANTDEGQNYLGTNQRYSEKDIEVNFSAVTFEEPGIYRYFLKEEVASDSDTPVGLIGMDVAIKNLDNKYWRTIDVYVENGDDNILTVKSYVVYEGKLESTHAPREQIEYVYDKTRDFDPTINEAKVGEKAISDGIWYFPYSAASAAYNNGAGDGTPTGEYWKYEYKPADGGWVETHYMDDGTFVESNNTEHLMEAYAWGTVMQPTTAKEAIAMGAQKEDLIAQTWKYNSQLDPALSVEATWDSDRQQWHVTGGATETYKSLDEAYENFEEGEINKRNAFDVVAYQNDNEGYTYKNGSGEIILHKAGLPESDYHYNTSQYGFNDYKNIRNNKKVVMSDIVKYSWKWLVTDGNIPEKNYTATWDDQNKVWNVDVWVDLYQDYEKNGVIYLPEDATPENTTFNLPLVKYEYAFETEAKAQADKNMGYEHYAEQQTPNGVEPDNENHPKNGTYVNKYESVNLTVGKNVTGNQGSRDKYFKFTITLSKPNAADLYLTADKTNMDIAPEWNDVTNATYEAMGMNETVMKEANSRDDNLSQPGHQYKFQAGTDADAPATINIDVYLQSGESFTLQGVPANTTYTVSEAEWNKDGYTSTATVEKASNNEWKGGIEPYNNNESETIAAGDHTVIFTNDKSGVIPTGVAIGIGAGAVLLGIVVVYIIIRRRTRYAYEDEE